MSTRAVYTFIEGNGKNREEFHIYGHSDGYLSGATEKIKAAIKFAWKFPRFEASEFAAAFVRGNKDEGGGNIYLTTHWKDHGDLEYRYEIVGENGGEPQVIAYEITGYGSDNWQELFRCPITKLDSYVEMEESKS